MQENQTQMENTTNNATLVEENEKWVFIPLSKAHILKRTDKYVLFDVDGTASAILNTVFLRKKETDEMVFFSVPADYVIYCRVKEYKEGKWMVTSEYQVTAKNIRPIVLKYNKLEKLF